MIRPISKTYLLPLVLLIISLPAIAAESLPTTQDINAAAQKAKQTYDSFFTQTFRIRMQYEYSGRFLNPQDKDTFRKAAQQASADLEQIANTQLAMKKEIESYQKDDWETLFGQTGLWRKLAADLLNTQASKLEIDYHLARITGNLKVDQQFFDTLAKSGLSPCASIKASLEKIKCLGLSEPNELEEIARSLAKSDCFDNSEILLTLSILQNKYAPDTLEKTLSYSDRVTEFFGKIILADLSSKVDINSLNPLTAELAASAALSTNPSAYKKLLLALADTDKFKRPMVLYAAGISGAECAPDKTIKLLMDASALQQKQKSMFLDIEAVQIAEQAAQLADKFFSQKDRAINCDVAIAAFDNYTRIAADKKTEQMQYFHGLLLRNCGKIEDASEIFDRLANGPNTIWKDASSLELLKIKIKSAPEKTLPQLRNFILNCKGQDELKLSDRLEAMDIYCRTILGSDINNYATQVLNLLDTAEQTPGLRYDLFRAQALHQLGRLEESARYMSKAIVEDSGSMASVAAQIASDIVDKIELWQKDADDFNELLRNCDMLAKFAHKSANTYQTNLLLAEVTIIDGKKIDWPFPSNNEDALWPRVQARLLMQQEKFEQAAKNWTYIVELRRNDTTEQNQKSYGWWQAKFYELDCLSKSPQADRQNIAHVIDVLTGSNPQIPAPWAEKLDLLKKQCAAN